MRGNFDGQIGYITEDLHWFDDEVVHDRQRPMTRAEVELAFPVWRAKDTKVVWDVDEKEWTTDGCTVDEKFVKCSNRVLKAPGDTAAKLKQFQDAVKFHGGSYCRRYSQKDRTKYYYVDSDNTAPFVLAASECGLEIEIRKYQPWSGRSPVVCDVFVKGLTLRHTKIKS